MPTPRDTPQRVHIKRTLRHLSAVYNEGYVEYNRSYAQPLGSGKQRSELSRLAIGFRALWPLGSLRDAADENTARRPCRLLPASHI